MKTLPKKDGDGQIASEIHMEFIQSVADFSNDADGATEVEAYHRALFLNNYGPELERHQQRRRVQEERLQYLEQRLRQADAQLVDQEAHIPVEENGLPDTKPTPPWNAWDRGMFSAALVGVISLLTFGVLNVSFNLLESGIVTFLEYPLRAYFWAALLPVGALAVKIGWDLLGSDGMRRFYAWSCLAVGLVGVLAWVAAYASVYPTLSQTTAERIASLSVFDDSTRDSAFGFGVAKQIDLVIVASQAVAEIFLSAALGIYMTILYARHRPVRYARNPGFAQRDADRRLLEVEVAQARLALADATGSEQRLQNQLAAYLSFARSLYQREMARRKDQSLRNREMLEELTETFRRQLDEIGKNGSSERRRFLPADGKVSR